ncbi:hypothetical protein H9M94_03305 [Mycoplasma sp. Pen4]|uniref:hypothetical protein n=1 Tax=Mycoplasma sp. Pen4 TaxID=640330 RepID=UPI00165421C7|nr:hypothetical protein [Mycoplasma sp. Pen4]QNM93600.1 hypothetical protein H9M94_03305 [Mycoplasma sp. Pen4]
METKETKRIWFSLISIINTLVILGFTSLLIIAYYDLYKDFQNYNTGDFPPLLPFFGLNNWQQILVFIPGPFLLALLQSFLARKETPRILARISRGMNTIATYVSITVLIFFIVTITIKLANSQALANTSDANVYDYRLDLFVNNTLLYGGFGLVLVLLSSIWVIKFKRKR